MDSNSCNYNSDAEEDDGNCIAKQGCNEWCEGDSFEVGSLDNCGTCDADVSNDCVQDCTGEWGGVAFVEDPFGDCCVSIPEGWCDCVATATLDNCGTCDYNPDNDCVQDCADVWGGSDVIDVCNECGGDGEDANSDGLCDEWQGTVDDIEGNTYKTILIGTQTWMAENLKVTKYKNGDAIPNVTDGTQWSNLTTGAYAVYPADGGPHDNPSDIQPLCGDSCADVIGNHYNWYVVDDERGVCPESWHVASIEEWTILTDYLGGHDVAGGKMKSTGTIEGDDGLWYSPNGGATNESGFTAVPGGYRSSPYSPYPFVSFGMQNYIWSTTEYSENTNQGFWFELYNVSSTSNYSSRSWKNNGASVRCLKD